MPQRIETTIQTTVETLLRENLHGVFGEHDAQKRRNNIARLWAEDGDFIDHNARHEGHAGVDHAVAGLVEKFPTFTGIDVLLLKGDKIGVLYTFLDPPKK